MTPKSVRVLVDGAEVPTTHFTGDVGDNVAVGPGKRILWDAPADWDGQYSENVVFEVTADDGTPTVLFADSFSNNLSYWSANSGTWQIQNGKLYGRGAGAGVDAWIYAGNTNWQNYSLRTSVDFVTGNAELVVRSTGHWQNEYRIELWSMNSSSYKNCYSICRYRDGIGTDLLGTGNTPCSVSITDPCVAKLDVRGDTLVLYINDQEVRRVQDPMPLLRGRIGLGVVWTWSGYFDDVLVTTVSP